ncbi:MAG: glycosyltransferase [Agathobacter sp.]|nr:glycosyltransferase [Agathobacter sp.]
MNEWIKKSLQLCIDPGDTPENSFEELQNEFNLFNENQRMEIVKILKQQLEANDLIYVLSRFVRYMSIKEFEETLICEIYNLDTDCFCGSMLELQIISRIKGNYQLKKLLHEKNVSRFDTVLKFHSEYTPIENRNSKRIAIITEQFLSSLHAPTKIVSNFIYVIQKILGYEVLLFVCPSDYSLPADIWDSPEGMFSISQFKNQPFNMSYKDIIINGYQINMCDHNLKEYHMMFSIIKNWNPLFVLSMGTINPIVDLINKFTTLITMDMTSQCPISTAEYLLRFVYTNDEDEQVYSDSLSKNQKQIFLHNKMPVINEETINPSEVASRDILHLPEEKFLIAIVGNRLDKEIDNQFIDVMWDIFKSSPNIAFVIIGEVISLPDRLKHFESDSIYYLGYREDLFNVYKCLDLYINPNRNGGGFSSSIALNAGIPVICLPQGDVTYNVGKNFTVDSYEEMQNTVYKYVTDQNFYNRQIELVNEVAKSNTEEKMNSYVTDIINTIKKTLDI